MEAWMAEFYRYKSPETFFKTDVTKQKRKVLFIGTKHVSVLRALALDCGDKLKMT